MAASPSTSSWLSRFHQSGRSWDLLLAAALWVPAFLYAYQRDPHEALPLLACVLLFLLRNKVSGLGAGATLLSLSPLLYVAGNREAAVPYISLGDCTFFESLPYVSPAVFAVLALVLWSVFLIPRASRVRRVQVGVLLAVFGLGAAYNAARARYDSETFEQWLGKQPRTRVDSVRGTSFGSTFAWVNLTKKPFDFGASSGVVALDYPPSRRDVEPPTQTQTQPAEGGRAGALREEAECTLIINGRDTKDTQLQVEPSYLADGTPSCKPVFAIYNKDADLCIFELSEAPYTMHYGFRAGVHSSVTRRDVHGPRSLPRGAILSALGAGLVAFFLLALAAFQYRNMRALVRVQHAGEGNLVLTGALSGEVGEEPKYRASSLVGTAPGPAYVPKRALADRRPQAIQYRSAEDAIEIAAHPERHWLRLQDHLDGALLAAAGSFAWAWAILANQT
jgi:hypothetical protein